MSILAQDLRFSLRSMARRPGFTAVILATLALGIGANAAIFSVVDAVLLRPLPFTSPERIVDMSHGEPYSSISEPEFVDYQRGITAFSKLAAYNQATTTITIANADPMRAQAIRVSRDFFGVLGTKPEIGRVFAPDEFSHLSSARLTVISHRLWMQEFGGDPNVVGKTMRIGQVVVTIIGVMPADFAFPDQATQLWTAWRMNPDSLWTRNNHYLRLVGLLGPNATIEQARAQAITLDQRWLKDFPDTYGPGTKLAAVIQPIRDYLVGPTRPYLVALLGAVGFILLIACVNVANLLLVRGEARRKEIAIRTALGASSSRVIRQMLTESMLLAVSGAVLGMLVAVVGVRALVAVAPSNVPRLDQVGVDHRVVLFTIAITIVTGLLFGLVPALRGRNDDSAETLREGGKTSAHGASALARRSLVVAEVALAVVMLSGAGVLVRSLAKLQSIDLGFDPSNTLTMQLSIPGGRGYTDTTTDEFYRQVIARIRALPGVQSVGAVGFLPITGSDNSWSIMIDGHVLKTIAGSPDAKPNEVTPELFATMRTKVLRGRSFTDQDRRGAPLVAIISDGMAKKLWPGVDPIGHTLRMFGDTINWVTIVGVVEDVRSRGYQEDIPPAMYFPYSQSGASAYYQPTTMTIVARTAGDPTALIAAARAIVRSIDKAVPLSNVLTMEQVLGGTITSRRFATMLLGSFAALALALAGLGIYGVISYGVSQRTYEIGVRMAMGASPASIMRLVMSEGGRMTAIGLVLGLAGAYAVQRLMRSMLVGVGAGDAPTLLGVSVVLAVVAAAACALPARRATAVSPTEALRN
jgi:predicted permease